MIIPSVPLEREKPPFKITGDFAAEHQPWLDDFCLHCGADLRVQRKSMDAGTVAFRDRMLLALARSAERALVCDEPEDVAVMELLHFSPDEQQRLATLYCAALASDGYVRCGFPETHEVVGISADGSFVHAQPGLRDNFNSFGFDYPRL